MSGVRGQAIEIRGLTKDYGAGRGLFEANLAIEPGEVVGFIGANGAGKTVTMRLLMGFIHPNAGSASICGHDCTADRPQVQKAVGYLPGETALPGRMRARDFLDYMAELRGISNPDKRRELEDRFELDASARIGSMSKGTKQKVAIVSAFMGSPRALLLDEPTSGLDPLMQARFDELVAEERGRGTAVLLSSHVFDEVERTCDRVAFIRRGHVSGPIESQEIRRGRRKKLCVTFADTTGARAFLGSSAGRGWTAKPGRLSRAVEIEMTGSMEKLVQSLADKRVIDMETREQPLEEMFFHVYSQEDGQASLNGKGMTR